MNAPLDNKQPHWNDNVVMLSLFQVTLFHAHTYPCPTRHSCWPHAGMVRHAPAHLPMPSVSHDWKPVVHVVPHGFTQLSDLHSLLQGYHWVVHERPCLHQVEAALRHRLVGKKGDALYLQHCARGGG